MSTQRSGLVGALMKRRDPTDRLWTSAHLRNPEIPFDVVDVVTEDGARLRVHAYGPRTAEPIVLIHGWTCRIEYWNPQINALADRYRVIAYDLRGHGQSDLGRRKPSPDVLADDLQTVLAATVKSRKKALLVGHSMGGMTIMAWAARYPEQVKRFASAALLTNTGADHLLETTTVIPFLSAAKQVQARAGRYVVGAPVPISGLRAVTTAVFKARVMSPGATPEEVDFCQRIALSCKGRTRGAWGFALADLDVAAGLHNLTVPTSVLAGSVDRLTPAKHSVQLAETLDECGHLDRLTILPGVGHMGNVEAADAFNDEIVRMRSLTAKRRAPRRAAAVAG